MEHAFWLQRWHEGQIHFHMERVHPLLEQSKPWFLDGPPKRVLVPLCGKSWDVPWLADQGHQVVGVELVEAAVTAMFEEHPRPFTRQPQGAYTRFDAERITVWCGDFFALAPAEVQPEGAFDRVWDRASLVALPPERRRDYAAKLVALAPTATMLLTTVSYDPAVMSGPPFATPVEEVVALYGEDAVTHLGDADGLSDRWRARGHAWFQAHHFQIDFRKTA